jgi:hypothetical protein
VVAIRPLCEPAVIVRALDALLALARLALSNVGDRPEDEE